MKLSTAIAFVVGFVAATAVMSAMAGERVGAVITRCFYVNMQAVELAQ